MSYTPPAGNAADFSWSGAAAYTAPAGGSADFYEGGAQTTGLQATGFSPVSFGGPTANLTQHATGVTVANFGSTVSSVANNATHLEATPLFGLPSVALHAAGFEAARLGVPSTPLPASSVVAAAVLGVPAYINGFAASLGPVIQIPQAYYAFDQWGRAEPVRTPGDTGFGGAYYVAPLPPLPRNGWARGFKATITGSHSCLAPVSAQETGWIAALFGTPISGLSYATGGFATTALGLPSSSGRTRAAGPKVTHFGTPSNARAQTATAFHRATRWGTPKSDILGTCKAYGFYVARWAQPASRSGEFRFATGLDASARFGSPEPRSAFRPLHIASIVRYGRHILRRNTTC